MQNSVVSNAFFEAAVMVRNSVMEAQLAADGTHVEFRTPSTCRRRGTANFTRAALGISGGVTFCEDSYPCICALE